jgi:hypothetical protein
MDLKQKLAETDAGIAALKAARIAIPEEATEIREIIARALAAESALQATRATLFAWVIEHVDSDGTRPRYFVGNGWSQPGDDDDAIRYARQKDAERINKLLDTPPRHRVREHGWDADPRPPADPLRGRPEHLEWA